MTQTLAIASQARFIPGKIVSVDFSSAPPKPAYDIVIGQSILAEAATLIRLRLGTRRCVIISDSNVAPLYQARVEAVLSAGGHSILKTIVFPAGEASKNFSNLESLLNQVLALNVDRKTLIIALGGGVVGDITGLVASLVMRGLDFVQIPTTLLSQVDSSVGGKTGIDTPFGKNNIGSFYQPRLVLSDVTLLDSLTEREMRAGYAEIVKYGLLQDREFFNWCKTHGGQLLNGDHEAQIHAVGYACMAKAKIVADDEREAGRRALLNLGHTFGHALEAATGFGSTLIHGEAVSIGTMMSFRMAVNMGFCPKQDYDDVKAHFIDVGLCMAPPPASYDIDHLIELMKADKKAEDGKVTIILPHGIGNAIAHKDVATREISALWKEVLAECQPNQASSSQTQN
ncbi:MAG: 3-dehydroquinate synthase [Bdellovibrionales bacterium]